MELLATKIEVLEEDNSNALIEIENLRMIDKNDKEFKMDQTKELAKLKVEHAQALKESQKSKNDALKLQTELSNEKIKILQLERDQNTLRADKEILLKTNELQDLVIAKKLIS